MNKPIFELVDQLPTNNLTTKVLGMLNFVAPGQWKNLVGFDNTIREVTGETDEALIQQIGERAVQLYNDPSQGYQRAMWLYQTVDTSDRLLASSVLANKVGETIPLLGFIGNITLKSQKAQTIDFASKLIAELLAFCQINGIPGDSIGDFVAALADYSGESLIRIAGLICLDGLIPLGPSFLDQSLSTISGLDGRELQENPTFKSISSLVPGGDSAGQLAFVGESLDSVKGWMGGFVDERSLTRESLLGPLKGFVDFSEDKLDYLAAFLDISTNYYEHTGTQTLARRLIERAVAEI
jgi:hypothetical protein